MPHEHIPACLRGERGAQRKLYAALAPVAFKVAMRYLPERADAEDVVQNTFLRVFAHLNSYDPARARLTTWVHRIAVNESLRYLRKRSSLRVRDAEHAPVGAVDTQPLPTDHLAAADLRALILRLPAGYRAVFNLYEVEGYSHREIAEQLGITPVTSRSQLLRAKRTLRVWLSNPVAPDDCAPASTLPNPAGHES